MLISLYFSFIGAFTLGATIDPTVHTFIRSNKVGNARREGMGITCYAYPRSVCAIMKMRFIHHLENI